MHMVDRKGALTTEPRAMRFRVGVPNPGRPIGPLGTVPSGPCRRSARAANLGLGVTARGGSVRRRRAHTMSGVTPDEEDSFVAACTTLVTLRDGTRIRVRPIVPSDREQIEAGFEHLSEASRRNRFFTLLQKLPESWLTYLTELDFRSHVAIGAAAIDDPEEPGVAIARYIRCVDEPTCAEAAVTVIDEYQRRGIATVLLEALVLIALENGITRFCAYVQWGNPEVVKLARTLGASVRHDSEGVARVDVALSDAAVGLEQTAVGVALRTLARREASLARRQASVAFEGGAAPPDPEVSQRA